MAHNMNDIIDMLSEYIQKIERMINYAEIGCGRKDCRTCIYDTLCERLADLETELDNLKYPAEYIESEDL